MQDKTEPIPFPRTFREACRQFFGNGASAHPAVQFFKYGFVGGLATAVNVAVVFLFCWKVFRCITPDDPFVRLFGLEAGPVDEAARARLTNWAYVCAFPISNAFCYALNRMFVFVPGRHGALREFLEKVLGPNDDITHFQYSKKNSRERGPAVVGIELHHAEDFAPLVERMKEQNIVYEYLNDKPDLFQFLI